MRVASARSTTRSPAGPHSRPRGRGGPAPEPVARRYAKSSRGALFPLSERHGAWRVAFPDGSTVDFMPLRGGIEADLATRDFTVNAIAVPVAGVDPVDP